MTFWLILVAVLVVLFITDWGRDRLARWGAVGADPVDLITGAPDGDSAAIRKLHAYRVVRWKGGPPIAVLAPSQDAAVKAALAGSGDGAVGTVECLLVPHRFVSVGGGKWSIVQIPFRMGIAQGPCEHGGNHDAEINAQRAVLQSRIEKFAPKGLLEDAIVASVRDPARVPALHRALCGSHVHAVMLEQPGVDASGQAVASYPLINDSRGRAWLPIYSSPERFHGESGLTLQQWPFVNLLRHLWKRNPTGIVLNPNSALPIEMQTTEIEHILSVVDAVDTKSR